jgi:AcrR family transcriptional regulator
MARATRAARATEAVEPATETRRRALIDAALTVFMRYGFRKTSMEEVARAAQVSRQGLYLHFATKEDLFRAAVQTVLGDSLEAVRAIVREELPLETKLVRAHDEWVGKYVGRMGAGAADLAEAASTLMGPIFAEHEAAFVEAITKLVASARLAAAYRAAGLTARQLADTLSATARGLKYGSATREDFVRDMTVAVRAMCAPLRESR